VNGTNQIEASVAITPALGKREVQMQNKCFKRRKGREKTI